MTKIYPALKSNLWVALALGILPNRNPAENPLIDGQTHCGEAGWTAQPPRVRILFCRLDFWKTAFLHNRTQSPQHRVSLLRKYTDAIWPGGGAHKPSQGPTRGVAVLGRGVRCGRAVIGRGLSGKNLPPGFRFSESFRCPQLAAEDASMITAW